ncbi:MAG: hypothetical protein EAZ64_06020 [Sphingobacteriales bacterium]|nr:MAG: hypothetical protein EAZ64_06020 [Sphingobacteriales bacterium]
MKSRILSSSYIIDFEDIGFNSDDINKKVKKETDNILKSIDSEMLTGWEVHFIFRFNNVKNILIYSKGKSYPIERYKEITVHIPIPMIDTVFWGVNKEQQIYQVDHLDNIIKNFDCIEVGFNTFNNRADYILDSMKKAIKFCFNKGFTVNGFKIKVQY